MRVPRFRFTLRALMIAVATLTVLASGEQTRRRWELYRSRYRCYGWAEEAFRDCENEVFSYCVLSPPSEEERREWKAGVSGRRAHSLRTAEYFAKLKRKYARAMLRPWEDVPPDLPPPPEL